MENVQKYSIIVKIVNYDWKEMRREENVTPQMKAVVAKRLWKKIYWFIPHPMFA